MEELMQDVSIARDFKPMPQEEKDRLLAMTKVLGGDGRHELFKSSQIFDGPYHRKQHGFATDS